MESSRLKKFAEYTSIPIISVIVLLLFTMFSSDIEPFIKEVVIFLICFVFLLLLLFIFSEDLNNGRWKRKLRKFFRRRPLIAIIKEENCNKIKSRFEPEDWGQFLGTNFNCDYITTLNLSDINDKYDAIINPYGECYPEKDILEKISFKMIKKYVKKGGIFVNISGCPFWFNCNKLSLGNPSTAKEVYGISGDTVPTNKIANIPINQQGTQIQTPVYKTILNNPIYNPNPVQSLVDTLSFEELGILTTTGGIVLRKVYQSDRENDHDIEFFGDLSNVGGTDYIFEFRAVRKPVQSCVPILRSEHVIKYNPDQSELMEIYPLVSVPCGNGYFVITGMHMDIKSRDLVTFIDEEDNENKGHILEDEAVEIINAQAEKVCQALINLLNNRDRIRAYVAERQ